MKTANLGDLCTVDGDIAAVIGISNGKTVHFEFIEKMNICPHCKKEIGKEFISMLESCSNFQHSVEAVKTIKN